MNLGVKQLYCGLHPSIPVGNLYYAFDFFMANCAGNLFIIYQARLEAHSFIEATLSWVKIGYAGITPDWNVMRRLIDPPFEL